MSQPSPSLVQVSPRPNRRIRRVLVHAARAALFGLIVLLIHFQHQKLANQAAGNSPDELPLSPVREVVPSAVALERPTADGGWEILDEEGNSLGFALQTSPAADHIIGFSGPTNVLLVFDPDRRLRGITVLQSEDTQEHLEAVENSPAFFSSLIGRRWDELADPAVGVDAVSGATLTSLAIRESILHRLGGEVPVSLRFPGPLELHEIKPLFPNARSLETREGVFGMQTVVGNNEKPLGAVLRSSPAADGLIGYQGPTETLIGFNDTGHCLGLLIRKSYDNAEYVDYVRVDDYFPTPFAGKSVSQLAELDLKAAGVEGVSGATMTSMAVSRGIKQAAAESLRPDKTPPLQKGFRWKLSFRDWGTILVLVLGLLLGFTNLRGRKWVRIPFQVLLIAYLGFINGDLVSQALLVGWAKHGVPWQSAGGLVLLSAAAVILPILSKQNAYCHQLCPHGAAQQLLRNRLPWQLSLPRPFAKLLSVIPAVLLGLVIAIPMLSWSFRLVNLEPFDAYVFRVAGMATVAIFLGGLIASLFVPMAYCRFGCPTGALLGYLRFHGQSDRLGRKDAVAVGLLAMALLMFATAS